MEPIITRTACLEDLEVLLAFEQGIIAFERPFDATLKQDPISYYDISAMILAKGVEVIVAVCGSEIVGSGYARIATAKPYLNHSTYAYLGFMYVSPSFRGNGVIGIVIHALKKWASTQQIKELRLDVYNENSGAIRAYEKVGFKSHLLNMRLDLKE